MEIFPERLVSDLARLPGGSHTYLKQLCAPDGAEVRARLQRATERIGPLYEDRAAELLGSLENRRFFQGFAEVSTLSLLQRAGWELRGVVPPAPRFALRAPTGETVLLAVLSFLHQTRPGAEEDTRRLLRDVLARVNAKLRFVVLVRRWLPHDFDPEPVRRAVEMWLTRLARQGGGDRYATYDDDHVSLEFCLTGERVRGRQSPVALVLGPYLAHRTLAVLEPKVVQELDRHRASAQHATPELVAAVSDQPWALTPGYLHDFLYGRSAESRCGPDGRVDVYNEQASVSLFRDPLYRAASGVLLVDRIPADPAHLRAQGWLNPWAEVRVGAGALGVRTFAEAAGTVRAAGVTRSMRWTDEPSRVELG